MTNHRPVIETLINTVAIAFTAYGVTQVTSGELLGYLAVGAGVGLELIKYWGRKNGYWGVK